MASVIMSWSGGKDSTMALYELQRSPTREVATLLTTITSGYDRISMHGVRRELLHLQADAIGLPLYEVFIPARANNSLYEAAMADAFAALSAQGTETVAFGDLFLEDIRTYRDSLTARNGMRAIYPVWGRDTTAFIRDFLGLGFQAVVTCVDTASLDESFSGRIINEDFLADLPANVDPCGENGEFHSFVFDGPNFSAPVSFTIGDRVTRDSFCFCDLEPQPV